MSNRDTHPYLCGAKVQQKNDICKKKRKNRAGACTFGFFFVILQRKIETISLWNGSLS
jgi:hypothetical protein